MTDATGKNKIVFVPGKNPKPRPEAHRVLLWRCLLRGLELVDPAIARTLAARPESFVLIAWNRLFYGEEKEVDEDQPWIEALCHKSGPDAADVREALSWRNKLARFLYLVADHLPFLIPLLPDPAVRSAVVESERYFHDHDASISWCSASASTWPRRPRLSRRHSCLGRSRSANAPAPVT